MKKKKIEWLSYNFIGLKESIGKWMITKNKGNIRGKNWNIKDGLRIFKKGNEKIYEIKKGTKIKAK